MAWTRVIGNDFAGANQQALGVIGANNATIAGNIARQNQAEQYWNSQLAAQEEDAWRRQAFEENRRLQSQSEQRRQFEWGTARQDAAARDALSATLDREKIAAAASRPNAATERAAEHVASLEEQRLADAAARGDILAAEQAAQIAPHLTPELHKHYLADSLKTQATIDAEDKQAEDAAKVLNAFARLKGERKAMEVAGASKEKLNEIDAKIAQVQYPAQNYQKALATSKHWLADALTADESGTYHASRPARAWRPVTAGQSFQFGTLGGVEAGGVSFSPPGITSNASLPRWTPVSDWSNAGASVDTSIPQTSGTGTWVAPQAPQSGSTNTFEIVTPSGRRVRVTPRQ